MAVPLRAALTLLALALALRRAAAQPPPPPPPPPPSPLPPPPPPPPSPPPSNATAGEPLVICVAPLTPFVYCAPGQPPAAFTGFDVEMWRRAARLAGLREGSGYAFRCVEDFSAMLAEADAPDGACDAALGAISITAARAVAGTRFSFPYFNTMLGILVRASAEPAQGWGWTRPFSGGLWLALAVTIVVFPAALFAIEFCSLKARVRGADVVPGVREALVRSVWTLTGGETIEVSSTGAKLATVCFAFFALIVSATYTANLASLLTVSSLTSEIRSVEDLRGRAVATLEVYQPRLRSRYGLIASAVGDSADAIDAAAADVRAGFLTALVADHALVLHAAARLPGCGERVLPMLIEPFSYGVVFSPRLPQALADALDDAVLTLEEEGTLEELKSDFAILEDECAREAAEAGADASITFASIYGVFVIVGAGLVGGLVCTAFERRARAAARRRRRAAVGGAKGGGGAGDASGGGGGGGGGMPRHYQPNLVAAIDDARAGASGLAAGSSDEGAARELAQAAVRRAAAPKSSLEDNRTLTGRRLRWSESGERGESDDSD